MTVLTTLREVQIPIVAAMLLSASLAKFARSLRTGSIDEELGPTALFPMRMRRPLALAMSLIEFCLGIGLIVTAGNIGQGAPATCIRLCAGLLFLVATSALIELRTERPDLGCGCFGDFSSAPVSSRTLARSAFLAAAAFATIDLKNLKLPSATSGSALQLLAILVAEIVLLGALSPELGEGLIRLGYSEPCELRDVPSNRTLALLRRSKPWSRYSGLITADVPADVWRELCWRYVVYPAQYEGLPSELVFAVYLRQRRPAVHATLVDAATGQPVTIRQASPGPVSQGQGQGQGQAPGTGQASRTARQHLAVNRSATAAAPSGPGYAIRPRLLCHSLAVSRLRARKPKTSPEPPRNRGSQRPPRTCQTGAGQAG